MIVAVGPVRTALLVVAALLGTGLSIHLYRRWRHALARSRARRLAASLRNPAATLGDIEDQSAAVEGLVEFSDVQAAIQAARELLAVKDERVHSAAVEVLRRTRALDLWARDLHRGSYRAKLGAIEALGEVGDEHAVDELIMALGDDDPDVAQAASHAVVAHDPDYASERLAQSLAYPDRRLAETAAAALVRMGDDAVEALVGQLGSLNPQARRLATECLGAIGGANLVAALVPLLESDPEADVRVAVAEALARLGGDASFYHLRRLSQSDPDWFVRSRAYSLLAEIDAPGAAEFLKEALTSIQPELAHSDEGEDVESVIHGSERIRTALIAALRILGLSDEQIAQAERRPPDVRVASGEEEANAVWSEVTAALRERDPVRRADAARALANSGLQGVGALRRALLDPEPLVRAQAARSLGRIGLSDCLEALAQVLNDPDPNVRLEAFHAMQAIVTRDAAQELTDS